MTAQKSAVFFTDLAVFSNCESSRKDNEASMAGRLMESDFSSASLHVLQIGMAEALSNCMLGTHSRPLWSVQQQRKCWMTLNLTLCRLTNA